MADKGITTEELAASVLDSLKAVSDALATIEARHETIEEIEAKFDEVIENMNELKQLTRYKGVLQDLCKRHKGVIFTRLWTLRVWVCHGQKKIFFEFIVGLDRLAQDKLFGVGMTLLLPRVCPLEAV